METKESPETQPNKPEDIEAIKVASWSLYWLNLAGLVLTFPVMVGVNWYLVEHFFAEYLEGELPQLASMAVEASWMAIGGKVLIIGGVLSVIQFVAKSDKIKTQANVIAGLIILVILLLWFIGICVGLYAVWVEASQPVEMPEGLEPVAMMVRAVIS